MRYVIAVFPREPGTTMYLKNRDLELTTNPAEAKWFAVPSKAGMFARHSKYSKQFQSERDRLGQTWAVMPHPTSVARKAERSAKGR